MSTRMRKAALHAGSTLLPALRKSLLPACLAVLGLAAWDDVPLPSSWRPWRAVARQARQAQVDGGEARAAARLLVEEAPPHPWHDEVPSLAEGGTALQEGPEAEGLALPHTHGRRVDHLARARTLREL